MDGCRSVFFLFVGLFLPNELSNTPARELVLVYPGQKRRKKCDQSAYRSTTRNPLKSAPYQKEKRKKPRRYVPKTTFYPIIKLLFSWDRNRLELHQLLTGTVHGY
jgi:hypothetical protein